MQSKFLVKKYRNGRWVESGDSDYSENKNIWKDYDEKLLNKNDCELHFLDFRGISNWTYEFNQQ